VSALPSGGGGPPPEGDLPSSDTSPTRTHLDPLAGLAPGRVLAGRYRIEGLLGAGGMGVVYRAHDLELDIDVAVKLLRPEHAARHETRDRFRSELILARQVSHRNVVRIHDIDHDGELEFLTMDLVEGRSLRELIAEGPLAADRAMAIARQLAEALAAAHDGGVVHRDLCHSMAVTKVRPAPAAPSSVSKSRIATASMPKCCSRRSRAVLSSGAGSKTTTLTKRWCAPTTAGSPKNTARWMVRV
jgi:hypothetical protein